MKKKFKGLLWLLLPAIFILGFGCAKTKDLAADADLKNTDARSVTSFSDYYWYKGKQIPINKNPGKKYILFNAANEATVYAALSGKGIKLQQKAETLSLSPSIRKSNNRLQGTLKWAIVESMVSLASVDSSILYEGPFFTTMDGSEAGLSHLLYVKLKSEKDIAYLLKLADENKAEIIGNDKNMPLWYTLQCTKQSTGNALELANRLYETNLFASCQPDLMTNDVVNCVNDTYFANQWNLNNTGQYGGTSGVDIKYCAARGVTQGNSSIIVAVIDQGIQLSHPDLNIYNQSYDTESGTSPSQLLGEHGTACAGIIGAYSNNSTGVAGIASNCPLMSISNSLASTPNSRQKRADGFYYAVNNGASVISNSWGSAVMYQIIDDAIDYALTNGRGGLGCVVVFAAGNDNSSVSYPANSNPDIVVVGAISPCGQRKSPSSCDTETTWGSNYGTELDVVAPGVLIPTTDITGTGGYNPYIPIHPWSGGTKISTDYSDQSYTVWFNGTSAATPHVAGVAALVLSINPNLTQKQVANIIEQTSQKVGGYSYTTTSGRPNGSWNNEMGYGLLNAFAAVTAASCTTVYYNNQTVNTNTTVAGCSIESTNVTVNSGAKLTFTAVNYILMNADFEVKSGAEFEAGF
ncbi:S8 family serine peptidase [Niabella aquatica]